MYQESFIEYLKVQKRYSALTLASYETAVKEFYSFACDGAAPDGQEELETLTPALIRGFLAAGLEKGLSARTLNQKLSALSSYCTWLVRQGTLPSNPVDKVTRPKQEKRLPEFYTVGAMDNYFARELDPSDFDAYRDRMMVMVLYGTGMRRAELASLRIKDFDPSRQVVRVTGKGDRTREIPIPSLISQEMVLYLKRLSEVWPDNPQGMFFLTGRGKPLYVQFVDTVVKKELSNCEGFTGRKSPHVLRHTLATHLLNNGADLNSIKEILGHSSLAATQVYTHNSFEQLKNTYLTAHPRAKNGGTNGN